MEENIEVNFQWAPCKAGLYSNPTYRLPVTVGQANYVMHPMMSVVDMRSSLHFVNEEKVLLRCISQVQQLVTLRLWDATNQTMSVVGGFTLSFQMRDLQVYTRIARGEVLPKDVLLRNSFTNWRIQSNLLLKNKLCPYNHGQLEQFWQHIACKEDWTKCYNWLKWREGLQFQLSTSQSG